MTVSTLLADLQLLTPELLLSVGAMALLLIGVYTKGEAKARLVAAIEDETARLVAEAQAASR